MLFGKQWRAEGGDGTLTLSAYALTYVLYMYSMKVFIQLLLESCDRIKIELLCNGLFAVFQVSAILYGQEWTACAGHVDCRNYLLFVGYRSSHNDGSYSISYIQICI